MQNAQTAYLIKQFKSTHMNSESTTPWDIRHLYTKKSDTFIACTLVLISLYALLNLYFGYVHAAYFQLFILVSHCFVYIRLKRSITNHLIYFLIIASAVQFLAYLYLPMAGDIGIFFFILFPITVILFTGSYVGLRCTAVYLIMANLLFLLNEFHYIHLIAPHEQLWFSMLVMLFSIALAHYSISSRELLAKELDKARHDAELASQNKSDFLANISHELRTPLHGIIGLQNILAKEADYLLVEHKKYLNLAQHSSQILISLIGDILDLSKIEANKITLHIQPYCLTTALQDAVIPFIMTAKEKNLELSLHFKNIPSTINADELRIRQILLNLIGNAIKFTEHGFVKINAIYHEKNLTIKIQDSGIGIKASQLSQIFKPFVQLSETSYQQGTGLGTTISKHFVELMEGSIKIESQHKQGTLCTVQIPIEVIEHEYFTKTVVLNTDFEVTQSPPALKQAKDFRILLAEDDDISRMIAVKTLSKAGLNLDIAKHGMEAWEKIQQNNYDLLLTDIHMPGLTGIDLTKKIRLFESTRSHRTHIIGLSAHVLEAVSQECLNIGMDAFISKPISPEKILNHIIKEDATLLQVK